jgi:hypothetical protein
LSSHVLHERLKRLADLIGDTLKTCHRGERAGSEVVDRAEEELL